MTSTNSPLYEFSIPLFVKGMQNLLHCMDKAEAYAKEKGENVDDYVQLQIYPDMKNFGYQIQRISDTSKSILSRIPTPAVDASILSIEDKETTWSEVRDRLTNTLSLIEKHTDPKAFAGQEDKEIVLFNGKYKSTSQSYLTGFAIPNFYFHLTTAYDLLRMKGVPVGKMDYLAGGKGF